MGEAWIGSINKSGETTVDGVQQLDERTKLQFSVSDHFPRARITLFYTQAGINNKRYGEQQRLHLIEGKL